MTYFPNLDELERQDPGWYGVESTPIDELADRVGGLEDDARRARARDRRRTAAKVLVGITAGIVTLIALAGDDGGQDPAKLHLAGTDDEATTTLEDAPPADAAPASPPTPPDEALSASSGEADATAPAPAEAPTAAPSDPSVDEPSPAPAAEATTTTAPPRSTPTTLHPSATTTVPPAP